MRVVVVWQAIRGDGTERADPQSILDDARVVHLSDPDLDIGRWFGARDGDFHAGAAVAWDAFILFDADATFAMLTDHLEVSGHTIIAQRAKLRGAFTRAG